MADYRIDLTAVVDSEDLEEAAEQGRESLVMLARKGAILVTDPSGTQFEVEHNSTLEVPASHNSNRFDFTTETEIGVTYTPWTDGWAIGFKVTSPGQSDRYILLNPSNTDSIGEANCFVYVEAEDVSEPDVAPGNSQCYINVYDPDLYTKDDRVLTYCTDCGETLQTDGDQVPRESDLFDELLDNMGRDESIPQRPGHTHTLYHHEVA